MADTEIRVFQEKWSDSYFFTYKDGKSVCLICTRQISVVKECNIFGKMTVTIVINSEVCKGKQGRGQSKKKGLV